MLETLNYQSIIDLAGLIITVSLPIGVVLGLSTKLVNMFLSGVFGDKNIKI